MIGPALFSDLGYVGGGMPTTDEEAIEFAANVADPTRHLKSGDFSRTSIRAQMSKVSLILKQENERHNIPL